ncbi:M1 family metallopeptidase [Flavitalea sp.]
MQLTRLILLIIVCVLHLPGAKAQDHYWQQNVQYKIEVSLNDVEHTLDGFISLNYRNNSPDTIGFIWFHVWPNAFKNDKTAFSEQLLRNGKTAFYFSKPEQKGYINKLDFKSGTVSLEMEDHPSYTDVVKVLLHQPLLPGQVRNISTTFHVKLPYNFSRGGHNGTGGQSYQVTQWYPKPAVYDKQGWHPMPYLDQGEFYSEFGTYDVSITIPKNYVVAATGELQNKEEIDWMRTRSTAPERKKIKQSKNKNSFQAPVTRFEAIASDPETKTLRYIQDSVHDFAFFADKYFIIRSVDIPLPSGRTVKAYSFYRPESAEDWKESLVQVREAIQFRSGLLFEYPYNSISIVDADFGIGGGMEYPMITNLSSGLGKQQLMEIIEHEVGHNWFQGILATNERDHPWMDEGMNTYYEMRFENRASGKNNLFRSSNTRQQFRYGENQGTGQPIATSSADFSQGNYYSTAYHKAAGWLASLEKMLGRKIFDSAMKQYAEEWKFRHPTPEDFKKSVEQSSGKDLTAHFNLLYNKQTGPPPSYKKKIVSGFNFRSHTSDSIDYIDVLPVPGYNTSDGFMIGAAVHNYAGPINRFHFFVSPLYATRSKQFNGIADFNYTWYKPGKINKITTGLGFSRFSTLSGRDSNNMRISSGFLKFTPSLKVSFRRPSPLSTMDKWLEWKTYIIGETGFSYNMKVSDGNYYPEKSAIQYRYINQLTFGLSDQRVLYPYDASLQVQQAEDFYRVNLNAEYFYNYASGGGMNLRLFAAKFGYIGSQSVSKTFETARYQPKLTAVTGYEDYTYGDYFIGRQESEGIASQQIMMRDGGLKLRTDIFQDLQGRSDNWVTSINFSTSIPKQILPPVVPLKIFFDIGTYAGAWQEDASGSRFMYVAGLQLSLFKEILNIYAPIVYSKTFSDNLKTVPEENKFLRKISFSIDLHNLDIKRLTGKHNLLF